jgi:glycosyltransferase involved in cell wall biosynthesis
MPTLSVILITRNEEANLEDCLASLDGIAQQLVIVDANSADRTVEIAQNYGATIARPSDWPGFGPQKNRALDLATGDWVLSLDADERLTPALQGSPGIVAALFAIRVGVQITWTAYLKEVPPASQMI